MAVQRNTWLGAEQWAQAMCLQGKPARMHAAPGFKAAAQNQIGLPWLEWFALLFHPTRGLWLGRRCGWAGDGWWLPAAVMQ